MIELHLTLAASSAGQAALGAWAESQGCRVTCIELARGEFRRQLMLTTRFAGNLELALRSARSLAREAHALGGVEMKRTKLELSLETEARGGLYLEHHVKVRLSRDNLSDLARLGSNHAAHLSRNAFRELMTHEERFLTQRFAPDARDAATRALDRLVLDLAAGGYDVMKVERELVVVDDNLALDAGWGGGS